MRPEQLAIADKYAEDEDALFGREIHWYWEVTGGWGKTILAKFMVDTMEAIVLSGTNKDCLYAVAKILETDEAGPPIIIFDVPRCNEGHVSYQAIESLKNGLFFSGKYESTMVRFNSPHILIFSNYYPDITKMSSDRWKIYDLEDSMTS